MCAIIVAFCWRDYFISAMSAVVGSTIGFVRELWLGGVAVVGDVDIDKARKGKVGGVVSVLRMEILFDMIFLG